MKNTGLQVAPSKTISLGGNLAALIKNKEISFFDLARHTGVPPATIHRLVHEPTCNPTIATLIPIARFFNLTVSQLLMENPSYEPNATCSESIMKASVPFINIHAFSCPTQLKEAVVSSQMSKSVQTVHLLSNESFSIEMYDDSMAPLFPRGTILVLDPQQISTDGSYVLAFLFEKKQFVFKRICYDGTRCYLRSAINAIGATNQVEVNVDAVVLGSLVQATIIFK